ncbi:hypothetical protein PORCELAIN_84 [Mycobacterium phage Porcelain]|nr:hypothetical protein AVT17_gp084 [Mycobacterium phage Ariel]AIM49961.1 hypothetical protein PBI_ARIEL_84 [Mycobacterium phage Ariel]ASD50716.1 hypothetical protein PORCELAIN_84 [Mycobacterium phage Porcelain]ASZ74161.1 hypothetical protein SEA_SQUINT_85 [Mycobacterium phage Squint]ATS92925.1 hypothetical protein SEA_SUPERPHIKIMAN_82 [Mycobacterium phage Superphikiman]
MGYMTNLTILNDGFDQLEKYPDDFVEGIKLNMNQGGTFGVGIYVNNVNVQAAEHADATQLIAVGGNFSTKVHTGWYVSSHRTIEGQVALLKQWADSLGYRISRKK